MVYFAYVHSVIAYGLPFWGNVVNSNNVFITKENYKNHFKPEPQNILSGTF
jgi:hypothetical protein